jgi:hypothetical protein
MSRLGQILALAKDPRLNLDSVPVSQALLQNLMVSPNDPHLWEWFCRITEGQVLQAMASNDPFAPNYPNLEAMSIAGPVVYVGVTPGGLAVPLGLEAIFENLGVAGRTGVGKTTVCMNLALQYVNLGARVLTFDLKGSWPRLLRYPGYEGKIIVLECDDLQLCQFQPPPNVPPVKYRLSEINSFASSYRLYTSQRLLYEALQSENCGISSDRGLPPRKLIELVRSFKPGGGFREHNYKQSLLWTLIEWEQHLGSVFAYVKSNFLEKLYSTPGLAVIRARSQPTQHLGYLINHMSNWAYQDRIYNPSHRRVPLILILEDATTLADAQRDRETPGGVSPLTERMRVARETRIGHVGVFHSLSSPSPDIIKNCGSWIVCACQGEDERIVQHLIGTTPEQTAVIRTQPPGCAVFSGPSVHPLPFLIGFPRAPEAEVTDDECRRSREEFLSEVSAEKAEDALTPEVDATVQAEAVSSPAGPTHPNSAEALSSEARRLLVLAVPVVPVFATRLYEQAGISRVQGSALLHQLEASGLMKLNGAPTGRRGGDYLLPEITAAGWKLLETWGISPPKPITKGGWLHNGLATAIGEIGRRQGQKVAYEVSYGDVCLDVQLRSNSGDLTHVQIGLSTSEYEAQSILKAMKVPAVANGRLVLVCRDKAFASRVLSLLAESGSIDLPQKIAIRFIGEVLERYYAASKEAL